MRHRSIIKLGAVVVAGTLALSACGSRDEAPTTGGGGDDGEEATSTAVIGVVAPLTGDLESLGVGIRNAVELAIDQANEAGTVEGWEFELAAEDDEALPATGQQAATTLTSNENLIGVVGPLNSSVGQTVAPVLSEAGVVQVSPANTNPTLTMGEDWTTNPERVWDTYFRTSTTDNAQGRFAATYVYEDLGLTDVAVIHDNKTYGAGLTAVFIEEFEKLGGNITTVETINPDDTDYSSTITAVAATDPQLVYYGGEYPQAGPLSSQMAAAGLDVELMGGDGIYSGDYAGLAGDGAEGDIATSVGAPVEELDTAADFVAAYEEAGFDDPYEAYGAYAYDAANAIINAFAAAVGDAEEVDDELRAAVVDAMNSVEFGGAAGDVAFDEFGDTTNTTLTVYQQEGGEWAPLTTGVYEEAA